MKKKKPNILFLVEMDDQSSHSWEKYYVQAPSKKRALAKLAKERPHLVNRKMTISRIPKSEIVTDIY